MAQDSYSTIEAPAFSQVVEKRSRFLGEIRPVTAEEQAAAFLADCRARHHDARHHCSAWILRAGIERYGDDGEPQGTAGMPMLEVLRREGVTDVAVVVTRYFGGTLLGTGGLVRAYTQAAKEALDAAVRVEVCRCADFSLHLPYPLYDRALLLLEGAGAQVLDTAFEAAVTVRARLRAGDLADLAHRLRELSGGAVSPDGVEECFAPLRAET